MVEQARPPFSESVRDHISDLAKELAGREEEDFIAFRTARGMLAITSAKVLLFAPKNDRNALWARKLVEDVVIMDEILRQAEAIRQLTGLDPYYNHLVAKGKIDVSSGV
jgi:hypothetical protein